MVKAVIGEDNRRTRRGIRLRLERAGISVVGEAAGPDAVLQLARNRRAQVVVTDHYLSGVSMASTIRALTSGNAAVGVVVLTAHGDDARAIELLDAGAIGYLHAPADLPELAGHVHAAARGETALSGQAGAAVVRELVRRGRLLWDERAETTDLLSAAERAVVEQLCSGASSNEAIAARLHLSVNTVRSQIRACLGKTDLADRTQLALWGLRNGLGALPDPRQPLGQLGLEQRSNRRGVDASIQHR